MVAYDYPCQHDWSKQLNSKDEPSVCIPMDEEAILQKSI